MQELDWDQSNQTGWLITHWVLVAITSQVANWLVGNSLTTIALDSLHGETHWLDKSEMPIVNSW